MTAATSGSRLLERLSGLTDYERSRGFHSGRVRLDLSRMESLLCALPELPRPAVSVHVAGSEGKTSTTELIGAGLLAHGLLAATYTSPHLIDVRERLRIGGAFPPDALLDAAVDVVAGSAARIGATPSFFEFLTAVARVLYAHARVDGVVWETGLGGRLDATRLMHADLCVITSISLEHTAILGATVPQIAAEKAGILRAGTPVLLGTDVPDAALAVIEDRARALGCRVVHAPSPERVGLAGASVAATSSSSNGAHDFRIRNRVLAAAALDILAERGLLPARGADVDAALARYRVAGRLQRVGNVLFDGAHSVAACHALAEALALPVDATLSPVTSGSVRATRRPACIVFGATSGRDVRAMLEPLLPLAETLILTRAPGDRGVDPTEIMAGLPASAARVIDDPVRALAEARRLAGTDGLVVVAGSLYLVGHLLGTTWLGSTCS